MATGYNKFYDHNKQKEEKQEKEIKRNLEGLSRCPECGDGHFSLKMGKGSMIYRTCQNGHKLEAVQ